MEGGRNGEKKNKKTTWLEIVYCFQGDPEKHAEKHYEPRVQSRFHFQVVIRLHSVLKPLDEIGIRI